METYILSISLARHRQIAPARRWDQGGERAEPDVVVPGPIQEIAHELDDSTSAASRLTDGNTGT